MSKKSKNKNIINKFIRLDELENGSYRKKNEIDITKPSVLLLVTICYIFIVFFIIIGVPWRGASNPIPVKDFPVAIPFFIILYILVIGAFYIRDKKRKKKI
jgi:hypothetical protein